MQEAPRAFGVGSFELGSVGMEPFRQSRERWTAVPIPHTHTHRPQHTTAATMRTTASADVFSHLLLAHVSERTNRRDLVMVVDVLVSTMEHGDPHGRHHQQMRPPRSAPPGSTPTQKGTRRTARGTYIAAAISPIAPQP